MNRRTVGSQYGVVDLGLHRALELAIGSALIILPFVAEAGATGTVLSVVLGALVVSLDLSADRDGNAVAGAAGHVVADRVLAFLMAAVALVTALSGEAATAGVCAAAAVAQALLSLTTRYVKDPRSDEDTRVTPAGA
jgi:hypothetical protein